MRESRFKELVNLYLDDEIDEDNLQEFEGELRRNSFRRQTLSEYNLLHKATSQALSARLVKNRISQRGKGFSIYRAIVPVALAATCLVVGLSLFTPYFFENGGAMNITAQTSSSEVSGGALLAMGDFELQTAAIRDFSLATTGFSNIKLEPIFDDRFYLDPRILNDSFRALSVSDPLLTFEEINHISPLISEEETEPLPLFLKTGVEQPYRREPMGFTFQR